MTQVLLDMAISLDGFVAPRRRGRPGSTTGTSTRRRRAARWSTSWWRRPAPSCSAAAPSAPARMPRLGRHALRRPACRRHPPAAASRRRRGPVDVRVRHRRAVQQALEIAAAAAGDRWVTVGGGADIARQFLAAGLVDELQLHVVPVLVGDGVRLFGGVTGDRPAAPCCGSSTADRVGRPHVPVTRHLRVSAAGACRRARRRSPPEPVGRWADRLALAA